MSAYKPKFVFFGTPDVASKTLEILKSAGYLPSLIVTAPDRPQGRKMVITPPPVKVWAIENNIPYIQPEKIIPEEIYKVLGTFAQADEPSKAIFQQENMRGEKKFVDFFLVVAYGKILQEDLIRSPRFGSINIHYSLLPKYRGASPVESAILNGDTETGVSIQQMEYKMDAGPIIAEEKVDILPTETTEELRARLIQIGGNLLVKILPKFLMKEGLPQIKQDENKATFCKKIKKEDGLVDPIHDDPATTYNKFRAYNKWPRIYYFDENKKRVIITDATLLNGKFVIKKIIPEGGKERTY